MKRRITNIQHTHSIFVDCIESIKIGEIKEEVNEEESVGDPLSIHQETENNNICEDIKEEMKEEESVDDPLSIHDGERRINICTEVREEVFGDDFLCVQ